jgi:pimeloyl-ACP methyl ester carboxylesterase
MNTIYALLAHAWGGLVVAGAVGAVGWLIARAARWVGHPRVRFVGYFVYLLAALLAAGSVIAILRIQRAEAGYPPMGMLVDVGGYRLHVLAEGDARGGPTVIWIGGGHAAGLSMYHLHKAIRGETRSILFDRPGTGWSDTGPFPASTRREAEELRTLLEKTGERGPFVVVGHSYGGLLAANYARRYPQTTAAVVLLDPTPPDVFTYLPGGGGPAIPAGLTRASQVTGLLKLFGLWRDPEAKLAARDDDLGKLIRTIDERLAEVRPSLDARSASPRGDWVAASVFSEWFDPRLVAELSVYDGELGDLPVALVIPDDPIAGEVQAQLGIPGHEIARAVGFLKRSRLRYLATSSRSELVRAPSGTGHNFPYEVPDFLVETVRGVLARIREASRPD